MKILTTPWKNDFLELVQQADKSIKITSPFVKADVCAEMIKAKKSATKIELITSFRLMNIYSGFLDISAIEKIIGNNGTVKNFPKLHAKIYLFDDEKAIITSGNFTYGGMLNNYEYGVFVTAKEVVKVVVDDFNALSSDERTGIVKRTDIVTVKSILKKIATTGARKLSDIEMEAPEETIEVIETSVEPILSSLKGWKLEVFKCANSIPNQIFTLRDINRYEHRLRKVFPNNRHVPDKIRQLLQQLRDIGLIEFLGDGRYKKLWR